MKALPDFRDAYQLHLNTTAGQESATPPDLIANLGPRENCPSHWIKLMVKPDGKSFTITNSRNGLIGQYKVK